MILQMPHSFRWGDRARVVRSKTLAKSVYGRCQRLACYVPMSGGASGKLDIFLQHYFDVRGFFYYLHNRVIDAITRII